MIEMSAIQLVVLYIGGFCLGFVLCILLFVIGE